MLDEPPRPERGIVPWSRGSRRRVPPDPDRVRVERHTGRAHELRALFEKAEDSAAQLDSYLDAGEVLVASAGERVVGHLQLVDGHDAEHSEIKNMAVDPRHRGRGVGRALIEAAVDLARAQRRSMLVVATAAADIGNLRFYQRSGFRLRSIERDAFTPADGLPATRALTGSTARPRLARSMQSGPMTPVDRHPPVPPGAGDGALPRGTTTPAERRVRRFARPGVAAAIFPKEPERSVYNNAMLERDLPAPERTAAIAAMEPRTRPSRHALCRLGARDRRAAAFRPRTTGLHGRRDDPRHGHAAHGDPQGPAGARARGGRLGRLPPHLRPTRRAPRRGGPLRLSPPVRPPRGRMGRHRDGFDHEGDCGLYNVATLEHARRRGLDALTALQLHDAVHADVRRRACSRQRWPNVSTPRSASTISG